MSATIDDTLTLALNLARNRGWHVLPCKDDKKPSCRNGLLDASIDPAQIRNLFSDWNATLIGIRTGEASGVDVLDIDPKHEMATKWWTAASPRIPPTRTYQTRSGGIHAYFQHAAGIANTQSKLAHGVDTRGDGGYAIFWFAAGFDCLDHSPPAPWPTWLRDCVLWKPPQVKPSAKFDTGKHADKAIAGIMRHVAGAREGERNRSLYWAACRLADRVTAGQLGQGEAAALLIHAAAAAGLPEVESRRTIASALKAA